MNLSHAFKRPNARPSAREVVRHYVKLLQERDFGSARGLLADAGFHSMSPIAQYDNADDYIAAVARVDSILEDIKCRHLIVEGGVVCVVLDFFTRMDRLQVTSVAQILRVRHGKIINIESFFDAKEYWALFDYQT